MVKNELYSGVDASILLDTTNLKKLEQPDK
jgi:hypothetical protein